LNQQIKPPAPNNGASQSEFERDTSVQNHTVQTRIPIQLPNIRPFVTNTLVGFTVVIFLLQLGSQYFLQNDYPAFYGVKNNQMIAQGQLWRLFTPMFLHGSILHIAFNMYALLKLGPGLERYYGHWRFLALYILSGFGGNVFSMMFTDASSLGSSTAIFGLIGAQGVFFYHNRKIFGANYRQALNGIIMIAAVNLIIGLSPGIDNWGHIGGLIGGVVFAWIGGPILDVTGIYPNLALVDQRQTSDILQALGMVVIFFSALTAGALYLMR
jgi:rhomboid protease GluP